MVTLLSTTAFGGGSPSPISPLFTTSVGPSRAQSPTRDISPLTPSLPSKPWLNTSVPSPTSTVSVETPGLTPSTVQDTPLTTPVPVIIPPRMDSFKIPAFLENDPSYKQVVSSYVARPLPQPPAPGAFPARSTSIAKPWMDSTAGLATPPRSTNNSPKYSLFPSTNSPGSARFPPTPPRSANLTSPSSSFHRQQSPSPTPSRFAALKFDALLAEPRPNIREHRSHTEPHIQPPSLVPTWQPRSASLNRSQTVPVEHLDASAARPSISVPPNFRRPSAVEMIARKEAGTTTTIKAGPGHIYQVSHATGPEIEGQAAVKMIKKSEKALRKASPSGRKRSVSPKSAVEERAVDSRQTTSNPQSRSPQQASIENCENSPMETSPLEKPFKHSWTGFGARGPQDRQPKPEIERKSSSADGGPKAGPTLERGRSLRRQNVPTPLALAEPEEVTIQIATPLPQWDLPPPSTGPLEIRASAFKPFSPHLEPEAIIAFAIMKQEETLGATSLAPPVFEQVNTTDKFTVEDPRKDSDARSVQAIGEITEMIEAEEARWAQEREQQMREQQLRERKRYELRQKQLQEEQLIRRQKEEEDEYRNRERRQTRRDRYHRGQAVGAPPGAAEFLEIKPLPPPPPAPVHLVSKPPIVRSPSPLAKLASLVK